MLEFDDSDTTDDLFLTLDRICGDAVARRELLWLRAHEKDDEEAVRDIEALDPGLGARMRAVLEDRMARSGLSGGSVEHAVYGQLFDERYAFHAARLTRPGPAPASRPAE